MNMSREEVLKFLIDNDIPDIVIGKIVNNINFCSPRMIYINRNNLDDKKYSNLSDGYQPGFIKCPCLAECKDELNFQIVDRVCQYCRNKNRCIIYMNFKCDEYNISKQDDKCKAVSFSNGLSHGESISYKEPYFEETVINPEYTPCATKCVSGTQACYNYPATPKCLLYTPSDLKTMILQYDARSDLKATISAKMAKKKEDQKVRVLIFRRTWFKGRNNEFLLLFGDFMCIPDQFFTRRG